MKRLIFISILTIIMSLMGVNFVYGYNDAYTLKFKIKNNKEYEQVDLYILLSKEYIIHAIQEDNLDIKYNGAYTLIENDIPSIPVNKDNVKTDVYRENDVETEYVQILLEINPEGIYEFDILSSYPNMDIKFRIKNVEKDYIVHIDNFKVRKNICEINYDYDSNTVKQPDKLIIPFATKALVILAIIVAVVGIISYIKGR